MKTIFQSHARLIILAGLCPLVAAGEIVTFDFVGQVDYVYNPFGVVSPSLIRVNDPVQISLRFDTSTPDVYDADPLRGSFVGPGWLKMSINGLDFEQTTTIQVDIMHGGGGGEELFHALAFNPLTTWPESVPAYPFQRLLLLAWETGPPFDFLSNAELPSALDFSRADVTTGTISTSTIDQNMYELRFSVVQVPEPSVTSLFMGGLLLGGLLHLARDSKGLLGASQKRS